MLELFEWPPTRSQRIRWVLEELELEYSSRPVNLMKGEQHESDYRAIHPLGAVPALRTDSYSMTESGAILLQLIEDHPEKGLAPEPGTADRAAYYQWSFFACGELDPAVMLYFDNTMRPKEAMRPAGSDHEPALARKGKQDFDERAEMLSTFLQGREFLVGDSFSGADILIGHSCFMATATGLISEYPVLQSYYEGLQTRPAYQRAYAGIGTADAA